MASHPLATSSTSTSTSKEQQFLKPQPQPRPGQPSKRLIVCCDGTWQAGDHVRKGDSSYQTNVTRMCHALADYADLENGTRIPQIIYYQSGVGSSLPTAVGRTFAGAIGYGVNENILSAYNFLVNNYNEDDEICLFGFSRGSFTCRSLAGLISQFGILKQEAAGEYFAGIWDRYQSKAAWDIKGLTYLTRIKVMGCWDTVGSLGIPEGRFTKLFNLNREYAFHDTSISDKIDNAFHALALDEHRKSFSPTLWYLPPHDDKDKERLTNLKQCWFPGVHTDVGRGYEDHVPGDTADMTFAWMVDQCHGLLAFNETSVKRMLERGDYKKPEPEDKEAERQRNEKAKNWGPVPLHDSMTGVFVLGNPKTRSPGQYTFPSKAQRVMNNSSDSSPTGSGFVTRSNPVKNATPEGQSWYKRLWNTVSSVVSPPEDVSKLPQVFTSEVIHPSVRVRRIKDPTYDPPALRDFKLTYDEASGRCVWVKQWPTASGAVRETELHEDRVEEKSFTRHTVDADTLRLGVGQKDPIPPRPSKPWWSVW